MKKQLIIISDMEGASGIFDDNLLELKNGSKEWEEFGRDKMTSDILAVCEAANEYGIDEILYYDSHYAGSADFNVRLEKLPENLKVFDVPDRCFYWRRIRGQASISPFGIITVGQHSRYGEKDAYFPHTIQSPPIKGYWVNDKHIAEIGSSVLNFQGVRYLANIGCASSKREAKEISEDVLHISVKDKSVGWEPSPKETYDIIKSEVLEALENHMSYKEVEMSPPYEFRLELCEGYSFDAPELFPWRGRFTSTMAFWESPTFEIGSEIFNFVRDYIKKTNI